VQLDFHLFGEGCNTLTASERENSTGASPPSESVLRTIRAGEEETVFLAAGISFHNGYAAFLEVLNGPFDLKGPRSRSSFGELVEDLLSVERTVVVADSGMFATDDQVTTAVILTKNWMEQNFAETGRALYLVVALDSAVQNNRASRIARSIKLSIINQHNNNFRIPTVLPIAAAFMLARIDAVATPWLQTFF
jgi:hypothetical protein